MIPLYLLLFLLSFMPLSFGAVSLSITPIDGSNSLRLEESQVGFENRKELRVRVTSTNGQRYQVFQRILEPVINEKGESLSMQALQAATVVNSNTSGTLYMQNPARMSMGEQLLYSAGQGGDSDAFTITYGLVPEMLSTSGKFSGKLIFTVRSAGDGGNDQALVNLYVESTSKWNMQISGSRNPGRLNIKDSDVPEKSGDFVNVTYSGNSGSGEVRIYQDVELPQNDQGRELGSEALLFYGTGPTEGLRAITPTSVSRGRSLIYEGRRTEDNFLLYYLISPDLASQLEAGLYNGRIKYVVETDQGSEMFVIDLQMRIQPIFTMEIKTPDGGISFPRVLPNNPPQEKEVVVRVQSNLHRPYQVSQTLPMPMTNDQGKEISKDFFRIKVDVPDGERGQTKYQEFAPISIGEYPIFTSDSKGSPVEFKVIYRLQGYQGISPGNFTAPIKFSLNQN